MVIVIAGVTGSGKTVVGLALSEMLDCRFIDADDFHSAENKAKMSAGIPLDDLDRGPWLKAVAAEISSSGNEYLVVACSALKDSYRKLLQKHAQRPLSFVILDGKKETVAGRLKARKGHFMNPALLDSQLQTIEYTPDCVRISIEEEPAKVAAKILETLKVRSVGD